MNVTLQKEVRQITTALGRVVSEQAGSAVFKNIEELRTFAKSARTGNEKSLRQIDRILSRLNWKRAYDISHAFSLFFQLVNLCEERQRLRRLEEPGERPQSLRELFRNLKKSGVTPDELQKCLEEIEIQPVLTSHPTEAKRQTILHHIFRLNRHFDQPDEILEALWQTEEVRERKVGPMDEVAKTLFWFERTILETIPMFYRLLDDLLKEFYPGIRARNPFLTFASWVGGDRDGNPFVTPHVSVDTMKLHRQMALKTYGQQCLELVRELSHADAQFLKRLSRQDVHAGHTLGETDIFRNQITQIRKKLEDHLLPLKALKKDLQRVQKGLSAQNARRAANGRIQDLIYQVEACGYHLAELDFRGHSSKLAENSSEVLEEMKTIKRLQEEFGSDAANHYILSMTHDAENIVKLLQLAKKAGLRDLHIVPLFETIEDLERCDVILANLWSHPLYRAHLKKQGNLQEVMFGYSDSNKDGGYFAANWWLYLAQKKVADSADQFGVKLRYFHGKGGTIDRGGGLSYRSVRSQPGAVGNGKVRITEQGEVVSLKYSNPPIALRNLEQLASSVIGAYFHKKMDGPVPEQLSYWESSMQTISRMSMNYYRQLVYQTPEFETYFWEATPIDLIDHLRIGSRPSRRRTSRDIQQLRTIPWVFAWTQSRHLISAWYGVGYALRQFASETPKGYELLREMYENWPFFSMLIDNVEVSLAKADMHIAEKYAALVSDQAISKKIFGLIREEHENSIQMTLYVCKRNRLLQNQPVLAESIQLRNPYVDPLNYLQIRYLPEWRKAATKGAFPHDLYRLLALTVNGIAFGMKSTG